MPTPRGFASGDFDPAYALDEKFKRLAVDLSRRDYLAAEGLWLELVAAAWRDAHRSAIERAVPDAPTDLVEALRTVGLIDGRGMLPRRSFDRWIGAALARREAERNRKRGQRSSKDASQSRVDRHQPERLSRGTPAESLQDRSSSTYPPLNGGTTGESAERGFDLDSWVAVSAAVDELTGRPHSLRQPTSGLGETALELAGAFGLEKTVGAFRRASIGLVHPDASQLVLGANRLLRPIPTARDTRERDEAERDRRESERSRRETRRRLEERDAYLADGLTASNGSAHSGPTRIGDLLGTGPQDRSEIS